MRLITLFVPGLARRHVEGGALRTLASHPPRQSSSLVPSFPGLRASVSASVDTGTPPSRHRILFAEDLPVAPSEDVFEGLRTRLDLPLHRAVLDDADALAAAPREGILRLEFEGLTRALQREGAASRAELDALVDLDLLMGRLHERRPERLLLHGSSAHLPVHDRLDAASILGGEGRRLRVEHGVAWVDGPETGLAAALREAALDRPGVARVLGPRALELHGAPADRGVAVLCEPGWSFSSGRTRPTPEAADGAQSPVVLVWGPAEEGRWPAAVHDYRLAPSLARALGAPLERPYDTPLPL